jgi:hypothetical protein
MSGRSFLNEQTMPSAIISDGVLTVALWAVTSISLNESYRLPPIGSSGAKALVATHDDTVSLTGVLVGEDRFAWKLALENLADVGKRGSAIGALTGGKQSGLVLVTSMTIRTEMQIQSLSFSSSAARRDAIDVSISMAHMPLPGAIGKLLDMATIAVPALTDWK